MELWSYFLLAGLLTLGLFVFLLFVPKYRVDGPTVGLLTVGWLLIGIYVFKPTTVKFQGWEILKRVENVERNLRPFAIIDISTDDKPSRGLLFQTFKPGQIQFSSFEANISEYSFTLKPEPKYVEIRCVHVDAAIVSEKKVSGGMKYTYQFTSSWGIRDTNRCIVEAFF